MKMFLDLIKLMALIILLLLMYVAKFLRDGLKWSLLSIEKIMKVKATSIEEEIEKVKEVIKKSSKNICSKKTS